jgi:hypothetical protein
MPKPNPIGRPRKIDETVVGKLIEGFKDDFTVEEACRFAGIHKDTYYEECKRNPSFADEMDRAQDYPLILAKKWVLNAIRNPESDDGLALKFLERRQRDRYSPKIINEMTGDVTLGYGEIESAPKAKSPEEARRLAEEQQ